MNKGKNISVIHNVKKDIINYISNYVNVKDDDFKVNNINSRITYSVDYIDTSLLKKLGTYANIFQDMKNMIRKIVMKKIMDIIYIKEMTILMQKNI